MSDDAPKDDATARDDADARERDTSVAPTSSAAPRDDAAALDLPGGGVVAVRAAEMRARRHPLAIAGVYAFELGAAYVIASPVHQWAKAVWGGHPYGDEIVFRPGALGLMAWLNAESASLSIVLRTTALLFVVFALVGNVVLGALVAALSTRGTPERTSRLGFALRVGIAQFFPGLVTSIVFGVLEGFFLGVGFFCSSAIDHKLQDSAGDERAWLARLAVLGVFLVPVLAAGVVGDLARVTIARDVARATTDRPLRDGLITALRTARRKIGRALLAWGWRAALASGLVVLGAMLSDTMHDRRAPLAILFVLHQALIFGRAALRTSWLANALRLVDE